MSSPVHHNPQPEQSQALKTAPSKIWTTLPSEVIKVIFSFVQEDLRGAVMLLSRSWKLITIELGIEEAHMMPCQAPRHTKLINLCLSLIGRAWTYPERALQLAYEIPMMNEPRHPIYRLLVTQGNADKAREMAHRNFTNFLAREYVLQQIARAYK